ncbi:DUF4329 domain-containing protein [Parasedimentitalea denitrificans]|nr:DUF4329 domain-containing protein [Sedimentitalea sp. CY04]
MATPTVALAQAQAERNFARKVLTDLQRQSFAANREYCGIIGLTETGGLIASAPRKGSRDSCRPKGPRSAIELIASYHTHAGFDEDADSEVPSASDVIGDMEEGLDGYVSTPGGRLWFIDGQSGTVRQLCGLNCLPADPDFLPDQWEPVKQRFTLSDLEGRN